MGAEKKNYYIIDGNSFVFRAFFALPQFSNKNGQVTNAIFGFTKMLLKLIKDNKPDLIAVAFDHKGKSFRHEAFEDYKAHREKTPDELISQFPYIKQVVQLLGIPMLEIEGVEADDSIATFVKMHQDEPNTCIYMVTGDKDMMQLVNDHVFIYDTMKEKIYTPAGVKEKMGVDPDQIPDLLGLMGDSADNIPGVPGVGPKTAVKLLEEYRTVENIIEHTADLAGSLKTKFEEHRELAKISKELATAKCDVDLAHISMKCADPQIQELHDLFEALEFRSLRKELADMYGKVESTTTTTEEHGGDFKSITKMDAFEKIKKRIINQGECAFSLETVTADGKESIVGCSLALSKNDAYFLPFSHPSIQSELVFSDTLLFIKGLIDRPGFSLYGHNLKAHLELMTLALDGKEMPMSEVVVAEAVKEKDSSQLSLF